MKPRSAIFAILATSLLIPAQTQPARAAGLDQVLKLLIKSFPAPKTTTSSVEAASKLPTPGLRGAIPQINKIPKAIRPDDVQVNNAYLSLLARSGVTPALMLSCPSCIPKNPKLPDHAERAARLTLENDLFLAAKASGNALGGTLSLIHPGTGKPTTSNAIGKRIRRPEIIAALAEAMGGLREGALAEAEFQAALTENLKKLAQEPQQKSHFGLKEIAYNDEKGTLSFKIDVRNTSVHVASLNIKSYVDRLTGLVFGAGGIYLLQPQSNAATDPPLAGKSDLSEAKAQKVRATAEALTAVCTPYPTPACLKEQTDEEIAQELYQAVWAEALLEALQAN